MKTSTGIENIVFWELSPLLPVQGHFNSLLENNKLGIISCSPFCSPKESSPRTVGVEGGGGGVSWKLYKFWSSSHLFLHSWTMQHYRKRPRNYSLIMVSILSALCLIYCELVECEGEKNCTAICVLITSHIYWVKVHKPVLKSSWFLVIICHSVHLWDVEIPFLLTTFSVRVWECHVTS